MFKDKPAETPEEKLIAQTAKAFFIPYTAGDFPQTAMWGDRPIITETIFKQYLEACGTDPIFVDDAIARFLAKKQKEGIFLIFGYRFPFMSILLAIYTFGHLKAAEPPLAMKQLKRSHSFQKSLPHPQTKRIFQRR
jgi:hypothetical protein